MYLVKTPFLLKKIYPSLLWDIPAVKPVIYLTFDDGPVPEATPFVLDQLKMFNAKATFFCIGDNVRKHPPVFQRVIDEGHHIGNHTFNHLDGWRTPLLKYIENVDACNAYFKTTLFRPPYGHISPPAISRLKNDFRIVMWDILSGDWDAQLDPGLCLRRVLQKSRPGSIVVFHDSIKAFPRLSYVLPRALAYWSEKGYSFEAIPYRN